MSVNSTNKKNIKEEKIFLQNMIKGYTKMGKINAELAKSGLHADNDALNNYEQKLTESENSENIEINKEKNK